MPIIVRTYRCKHCNNIIGDFDRTKDHEYKCWAEKERRAYTTSELKKEYPDTLRAVDKEYWDGSDSSETRFAEVYYLKLYLKKSASAVRKYLKALKANGFVACKTWDGTGHWYPTEKGEQHLKTLFG